MYFRLFSLIAIVLSLSACAPSYSGSRGYYRSEVYTSPAPYYYGGYGSYNVYPRVYAAPRPYIYADPRGYQGPRYYQGSKAYYQERGYRPDRRAGSGRGNGWRGR